MTGSTSSPAFHLALDSCTGKLLYIGLDGFERMAVIRFTRKRLGMNGELAILASVKCCGDRPLDTELINHAARLRQIG